jgi:broad specificity phosphatase PhoE
MVSRLFLVRHGETEWSRSGQHTGRSDIPLTARGEDEASNLAASLKTIPFAHVLTSPQQRARRTCELAGLGSAAIVEPDLAEWDYGDYEGRRSVDIRKERPGWNIFRDGCPGGETTAQVCDRADRLIQRLCGLDGDLALFFHRQFGCVLTARWIGGPVIMGQHLVFGPAAISILGYSPSHPDVRVIVLWNTEPRSLFAPAQE